MARHTTASERGGGSLRHFAATLKRTRRRRPKVPLAGAVAVDAAAPAPAPAAPSAAAGRWPARSRPRFVHRLLDRIHRFVDGPSGALAGGAMYGSWAAFANHSSVGPQRAAIIGLTHMATSFGLTLAGVKVMNALYAWAGASWRGGASAFFGSLALTYLVLIGVHLALGTPHLLLTLAPGLLPTIGFCFAYTFLLFRADARALEAMP